VKHGFIDGQENGYFGGTLGIGRTASIDYRLDVEENTTAITGDMYTSRIFLYSDTTVDDAHDRAAAYHALAHNGASNLTGKMIGTFNEVILNGTAGNADTLYGEYSELIKGVGANTLTAAVGLGLLAQGTIGSIYALEVSPEFLTDDAINVRQNDSGSLSDWLLPLADSTGRLSIGEGTTDGIGKLTLRGTQNSATQSPTLGIYTDEDVYPTMQLWNYGHDNVAMYFDAYYDLGEKASDATCFSVRKRSDDIRLSAAFSQTPGAAVTWTIPLRVTETEVQINQFSDGYSLIFNEDGESGPVVRMESAARTHMFYLDGPNNAIGINESAPVSDVHINGDVTIGSNTTEAWPSVGLQVTDIAGTVTLHDDLTTLTSMCGVFGKRDGQGFDGNILLSATRTTFSAANCRVYFGGYDDGFTGTSKTGITASIAGRGQGVDPDSGGYLDLNVSQDGLTETLALRCDNSADVYVPNSLIVNDGSLSGPVVRFESATKTHMFYMDGPNDAIGINGSAPVAGLHVFAGTAPVSAMTGPDNRGMALTSDIEGSNRIYFENTASDTGERVGMLNNALGALTMSSLNDTATAFVNQHIMTWNYADGHVGVNIQTAASPFHVYENTTATGTTAGVTIEQDGTGDSVLQFLLTGGQRWVAGIDNSDSDSYKIASSADLGTNTVLTFETGGNIVAANSLGIGATPKYPLHITADGATQDITPTINRQNDIAVQLEAATVAEDMHVAIIGRRDSTEGTSNRNAGVILGNYNETTTHWLGQIYGQVENTTDNDGSLKIDVFAGGLETGRNNALRLADNGTVFLPLLGEVTASLLDVQYNSSTGELGYVTSSLRYKEHIREEVDSAWLLDLDVVTYDRKDGSRFDEVGIIAEQIAEVRPQYVAHNKEGEVESYSKVALIPLLLKEIQKLAARVELLEAGH
jgi:hypothetical protein